MDTIDKLIRNISKITDVTFADISLVKASIFEEIDKRLVIPKEYDTLGIQGITYRKALSDCRVSLRRLFGIEGSVV